VVDDGIATGATMRTALRALRRKGPRSLTLAVPVAPVDTAAALRGEVDRAVTLATPRPFHGVGAHFRDFDQLDDDEVRALLQEADRLRRDDTGGL
jgi:predicted phosphoribosyltransferase